MARYLVVVDRRAHDANSKHRILSICRTYLAKRSTDKAVFQCYAQFEGISTNRTAWIWRTGVFLCQRTDRQTDRLTDGQTDGNNRWTQPIPLLLAHACGVKMQHTKTHTDTHTHTHTHTHTQIITHGGKEKLLINAM